MLIHLPRKGIELHRRRELGCFVFSFAFLFLSRRGGRYSWIIVQLRLFYGQIGLAFLEVGRELFILVFQLDSCSFDDFCLV
jgi:hypothetical protein